MKLYDTFDELRRDYFAPSMQTPGFDEWTIAKFTHTDDQAYAALKAEGKDVLGFQPTMLTLAHPLTRQHEEVVIKHLPTQDFEILRDQYRERFITQLPHRFQLLQPHLTLGDAVYDTWEQCAEEWIGVHDTALLRFNMPLLFDHVSDLEYWSWQQKGFDPVKTQRLIVTIFQYRTGRFAEVFIVNVNDAEMARIKLLIQSRLTMHIGELL